MAAMPQHPRYQDDTTIQAWKECFENRFDKVCQRLWERFYCQARATISSAEPVIHVSARDYGSHSGPEALMEEFSASHPHTLKFPLVLEFSRACTHTDRRRRILGGAASNGSS
ncbi:Hypothetical predicted protein [Pelobates cultripes]|uniref:Uncharacterized protein n=1 Tax=Pelobates cultripes TaxID=61616 RepID=A0AAD1RYW7_PELCU|nr:Hypothetical predicted protein [Pelobates cultripes]